ncbi:hypothetical protein [Lamprocystis purpurea]|jgi:hypothetical protein|uniref:hypothetical protein n=1 Tax=Lamprocystis purpurea TaxID=61598 RepID=UPI00035EAA3B|nr:hypothetical protein [Lamprocystis purpurea]
MTDLTYLALNAKGAVTALPLTPTAGAEARLTLTALPGSGGLHLAVLDGGAVCLRCEIPAADEETVEIRLGALPGPRFALDTGPRLAVVLPAEARYAPLDPIPAPVAGQPWDIALVIDGTTRIPDPSSRDGQRRPLLADPDLWPAMAGRIADLVERLAQGSGGSSRVTVLAFGDAPLPGVSDPGLHRGAYVLRWGLAGDGHGFTPVGRVDLTRVLTDLPDSPGGDFTDALGDALYACSQLHWRTQARRLVVLFGDSPGYALAAPVPRGGNARARRHDVDMEARRLHRAGVEILTLYQAQPWPTGGVGDPLTAQRRELVRHVVDQYLRLASEARLAAMAETFDVEAVAATLLERDYPLARGPSVGWAGPR